MAPDGDGRSVIPPFRALFPVTFSIAPRPLMPVPLTTRFLLKVVPVPVPMSWSDAPLEMMAGSAAALVPSPEALESSTIVPGAIVVGPL